MDERVLRFRVGVVVVAAATITVILIMLLGAVPNPFQKRYTVFIKFPEAPGVSIDTPVRKSGIKIGRVSDVELQDDGTVLLTLKIDDQYKIQTNEVCRISTGSLVTGDALLEFVAPADEPLSKEPIGDREYLTNGVVAGDPFEVLVSLEGRVTTALGSIQRAGDNVSDLAQNMNAVVGNNEDQLRRIIEKTEVALDSFNRAMISVDEIMGDPELKGKLKGSLEQFPELLTDARTTLAETRTTLEGFNRVSARAERNLANLENFTQPLAAKGDELADNIARSVRNIDQLLSQLVDFSQSINSREGSLGKLVHDPELYERLTRAAENVEMASRKLRPIVDDVRIFTDKIARDPRQLGVKGALDRRPSGAGIKSPIR